ncbi:hypothetical protein B0H34DRAFT_721082 [Crassisporium funariophilum]|nr:hypothetical protein B0H34DRAFT_721082 [Crassisporium funariophilum]
MVLKIVEAAASTYFPTQYIVHIVVGIVAILAFRAFSQGKRTNRERDLHARVVLITGGFTPLGLTFLQNLAQRGAHIIALSPDPVESPQTTILVDLLRTTTSNEQIFAEECDLTSPSSVREFCTRFLAGKEQRLDAVVFAHEYRHIGVWGRRKRREMEEKERKEGSLATFLITTLLLPAFLVAPVERDIRIVNVVNPFYAAAAGLPFAPATSRTPKSIFLTEGLRSLRSIIFTRHLQRILDALPSAAHASIPKTEEGTRAVPVVNAKLQKSNIVAVSVSPGVGRVDTVASFLGADWTLGPGWNWTGVLLYLLSQPLLRIFTKSPISTIQSVLHVLFLPTPFKVLAQTTFTSTGPSVNNSDKKNAAVDASNLDMPEEVLRPGALYTECAVVKLNVKLAQEVIDAEAAASLSRAKGKGKKSSEQEKDMDLPDDGEYGGELAGRLVWEEFERGLKVWEEENPAPPPKPAGVPSATAGVDGVKGGGGDSKEARAREKEREREKDGAEVY